MRMRKSPFNSRPNELNFQAASLIQLHVSNREEGEEEDHDLHQTHQILSPHITSSSHAHVYPSSCLTMEWSFVRPGPESVSNWLTSWSTSRLLPRFLLSSPRMNVLCSTSGEGMGYTSKSGERHGYTSHRECPSLISSFSRALFLLSAWHPSGSTDSLFRATLTDEEQLKTE